MPPDLLQWLPPGMFIAMSLFMALSILCEKYEPIARALGRVGGWLRDRAANSEPPNYETLHKEIADLKGVVDRQRGDIDTQYRKIKQLEMVEEVTATRRDMTTAYMQECALWYIDAAIDAAEKGHKLLPCRTWTEFCTWYRIEHGIELRPSNDSSTRRSPE